MRKTILVALLIAVLFSTPGCATGISELDSGGYLVKKNGVEWLGSGVYEVGKDVPAGVYTVVPSTTKMAGYYAVFPDENCEDILCNGAMFGHQRVKVKDGEFLKISHALLAPSEKVETNFDFSNLTEGGYWVGVDIPSGTYVIEADNPPVGPIHIWDGIGTDRIYGYPCPRAESFAFEVADGQYLEVLFGTACFIP